MTGGKERPGAIHIKISFVLAHIDKVFEVIVLAWAPIRKIMNMCHIINQKGLG